MKNFLYAFIALSLFIHQAALADEAVSSETPVHYPIENQRNYFGVRLLSFNGLSLTYSYRVADQLLVGVAASSGSFTRGDSRGGEGDLNSGQYYAQDAHISMQAEEANLTYFFRDEGYKNFGFLVRGGFGLARGEMTGKYYRYDQDPGVIVIGDGKRLQETGPEVRNSFTTPYARAGGYYQFVWRRHSESSIGAHILEMGGSVMAFQNPPSISILRPDGARREVVADKYSPVFEVAYSFVF
jgi:hypothetical protein